MQSALAATLALALALALAVAFAFAFAFALALAFAFAFAVRSSQFALTVVLGLIIGTNNPNTTVNVDCHCSFRSCHSNHINVGPWVFQ